MTIDGLPFQGYGSVDMDRVQGRTCMDIPLDKWTPEDIATKQVIDGLDTVVQNIARLYWRVGLKASEIARREGIKYSKARAIIRFIKEMVADKVLT